jgi:two-component system nitrogen regulation sensor histidine kinase GlnL
MHTEPKSIIEGLYTAVLVTDSQQRIVYANPAAEQLLSMSHLRLETLKFSDIVDRSESAFLDNIPNPVKSSFQGFTASGVLLSPEPGLSLQVNLSVGLYSGRGHGLLIEMHAIGHQQRMADAMSLQSQHTAARDLVRNLAHEIKNPLGGIRGAAQLLELSYAKKDPSLKEYTSVIIEQTDRLKKLVDNLLGPQQPNPMVWANIHYVIEKVLSLASMQNRIGVRFEKDYDPSLPELRLDVDSMQQVLLNIVNNAIEAMAEAKTEHPMVRVVTRAEFGHILRKRKYPTVVAVSITNNGPEIPEELRHTIFYPMVTTKAKGNGLGLSIAQGIIERHGGSLECRSTPAETTFKIVLPISKPPKSNQSTSEVRSL